MPYQNLNALDKAANELSEILKRLSAHNVFDDTVKNNLAVLKTQLENEGNNFTAEDYFKSDSVKDAINIIKSPNQHFLSALLNTFHLWRNEPHTFSIYEKIFVALSAITLLAGAILSYEVFVLFFDGKPRLDETGDTIASYCTTGLNSQVFSICDSLQNNTRAIFSMNKRDPMPLCIESTNISSRFPIDRIPSWLYPFAWFIGFTCEKSSETLKMMGHVLARSINHVQATQGIFPVTESTCATPLFDNLTIEAFFIKFCIYIAEGRDSPVINPQTNNPYGYSDGFKRPGKDFEGYAYGFADVYAGLMALALIAMSVLQCKKAMFKWQASSEKREVASDINAACRLFEKYGNIEITGGRETLQHRR